jgi:hypothetical protein
VEEDILSVNILDQNNSRSLTLNIRIPEFYNSKKSLRKGRCRAKKLDEKVSQTKNFFESFIFTLFKKSTYD